MLAVASISLVLSGEPRYNAGAHQRGLATAGSAKDHEKALGILFGPLAELFLDGRDLGIAPEEDGGVVSGERLQSGIRSLGEGKVLLKTLRGEAAHRRS